LLRGAHSPTDDQDQDQRPPGCIVIARFLCVRLLGGVCFETHPFGSSPHTKPREWTQPTKVAEPIRLKAFLLQMCGGDETQKIKTKVFFYFFPKLFSLPGQGWYIGL
jgi:hypothetical protein